MRRNVDRVAGLARGYLKGREQLFDERIAAGHTRETVTATFSPMTSSASPTGPACSTASSSTTTALRRRSRRRRIPRHGPRATRARGPRRVSSSTVTESAPASMAGIARASLHRLPGPRPREGRPACRAESGAPEAAENARRLLALAQGSPGSRAGTTGAGRRGAGHGQDDPGRARSPASSACRCSTATKFARSSRACSDRARIVRVDTGIYTPEWDARTYTALCRRAAERLNAVSASCSTRRGAARTDARRPTAVRRPTTSEVVAFRCSVAPDSAAPPAARALVGKDARTCRETWRGARRGFLMAGSIGRRHLGPTGNGHSVGGRRTPRRRSVAP